MSLSYRYYALVLLCIFNFIRSVTNLASLYECRCNVCFKIKRIHRLGLLVPLISRVVPFKKGHPPDQAPLRVRIAVV